MEQSAVEIDNDQGMQVEEIRESNEISVPQEQTDQSQTMDQNVDAPGHVEATPERKESTVHASTSKDLKDVGEREIVDYLSVRNVLSDQNGLYEENITDDQEDVPDATILVVLEESTTNL
ncbi:hypothetical protein RR46_07826 [Papilio xuthus]|uniref:Uncharacterized protein n=1 Tax=Papilio xuthus TaxID=66420 RepID=A0A194QF16_PAPXU|nr:hypothetical protein RR46_07826 [Papilio xuthus]